MPNVLPPLCSPFICGLSQAMAPFSWPSGCSPSLAGLSGCPLETVHWRPTTSVSHTPVYWRQSTGDYPLDTVHRRLSTEDCPLEIVHWRLSTVDYPLETADWRLSTGDCPLETVHWRLSTEDRPLETVHWRLATGDCQLETALETVHASLIPWSSFPAPGSLWHQPTASCFQRTALCQQSVSPLG